MLAEKQTESCKTWDPSSQSSLWSRQDKKSNHWQPGKEMFMEVAEQSGKTAPEMSPLT